MHRKRSENPDAACPGVSDRQMNELIHAAWKAGAWCERNPKTNYVKVYPEDGSRMIKIPSTPSDHRTYQNKRSALRRAGIDV